MDPINFRTRGIGLDVVECFCCGTRYRAPDSNHYNHNIAGFVDTKADGEQVVALFGLPNQPAGARLDYRRFEPERIQVKIGACDTHLPNLEELDLLIWAKYTITAAMVQHARAFHPPS